MERRWGVASGSARRFEGPTWVLIVVIYGGFLSLTACWREVPLWVGAPLGAWLCAWHMSMQHECIHGHPTRHVWLNGWLASPPLNLWLPYALYRDAHLLHHRAEYLTDPLEDPETTYACPVVWGRAGRGRRWVHAACNTAFGRVLLGPVRACVQLWRGQAGEALAGRARWRVWLGHAAWVCALLMWVCGVCHIGLGTYVACFVYPGTALIMIRSLAEHRAAERPADRTAVVERAGLLGVLFLNNNLHLLHHERPFVPWYALPGQWREGRDDLLRTRNGPVYVGYREVLRRYAVRPHHPGPHPYAPAASAAD